MDFEMDFVVGEDWSDGQEDTFNDDEEFEDELGWDLIDENKNEIKC